jgi:1,2-diacylglycerol 3-beta-galactosyltransferase
VSQRPRRILFVFLNTGGGHQSSARAVAEALRDLYGDVAQVDLVDVTAEYLAWPLSELNAIYNQLVRLGGCPWALTYQLTNGPLRVALLKSSWWLLTGESILHLLSDHPADAVVCCHPLLKAPIVQALEIAGLKIPLITLVTDLTTGHASWFVPGGERCLVATERARARALACGLPAESIKVTGLPVGPWFVDVAQDQPVLARARLGLDPGVPVVLLLSGANGMGPFSRVVRAVANSGVQAQLVIITGRNEQLRAELSSETWPQRVKIEGFVHNMHEWMRAADLLVTKAGPSTISEALVMGLPMVLSGALPGQERPNVRYVVGGGAGVWAPRPIEVAEAVQALLSSHNSMLAQLSQRAQQLARPDAAWRAAEIVWSTAS